MNRIINWKANDSFVRFIKIGYGIYLGCKSSLNILREIDNLQYIVDYYP